MFFSKKSIYLGITLSILFFVCSCTTNEQLGQNPQLEIESIWEEFVASWHSKDAYGCASIYLDEGLNIAPGFSLNQGREKIAEFYELLFSENYSSNYQHKILELTPLGDHLIERGEFQVDWVRHDLSTWTFEARTLTHWVKDVSGKWKIKTLIFNQ